MTIKADLTWRVLGLLKSCTVFCEIMAGSNKKVLYCTTSLSRFFCPLWTLHLTAISIYPWFTDYISRHHSHTAKVTPKTSRRGLNILHFLAVQLQHRNIQDFFKSWKVKIEILATRNDSSFGEPSFLALKKKLRLFSHLVSPTYKSPMASQILFEKWGVDLAEW